MPSKWLIRLLAAAGIVILIATIIRLVTPHSPEIPVTPAVTTNTDGTQTTFSNVKYTGSAISVPSTLDIATVITQPNDLADRIRTDYQLASGSGAFKVWQSKDYTMVYSAGTGQYTLSSNQATGTLKAGVNLTTMQSIAQAFVGKYFANPAPILLTDQVSYGIYERDATTPTDKALFGELPYSYAIDGYPLTIGPNNLWPLSISINTANQITKVVFIPISVQLNSLGKKTTISVDAAVANINKGQAAVTGAFQNDFQPIDLKSITSATLTSGKIQYRLDQTSNLAYPFYVFEGTGLSNQNVTLNLEISTPAVALSGN